MGVAFGRGWGSGGTVNPLFQYFKKTGITDATKKKAITDMYNSLKSSGIWDKMAAIYPLAQGEPIPDSYNLKDVEKHRILYSGSETHNSMGMTPNSGMPDFNINALEAANGGSTFHSAMYARNNVAFGDNYYDWGKYPAGNPMTGGVIRYTDNRVYYDLNGGRLNPSTPNSNATRLMVFNYLSGMSVFRDGTNLGSNAASVSIPDAKLRMNPYGMNLTRQFSFISFGQGLTATDIANLTNIVNTYQTTLGRAV